MPFLDLRILKHHYEISSVSLGLFENDNAGCVLLGLFRNRNTRNRRYLCSFGSYSVFGMNGISFRSFCSR